MVTHVHAARQVHAVKAAAGRRRLQDAAPGRYARRQLPESAAVTVDYEVRGSAAGRPAPVVPAHRSTGGSLANLCRRPVRWVERTRFSRPQQVVVPLKLLREKTAAFSAAVTTAVTDGASIGGVDYAVPDGGVAAVELKIWSNSKFRAGPPPPPPAPGR
jgi:hypothetical protein